MLSRAGMWEKQLAVAYCTSPSCSCCPRAGSRLPALEGELALEVRRVVGAAARRRLRCIWGLGLSRLSI